LREDDHFLTEVLKGPRITIIGEPIES
jgi:hypothetical protein